MGFLHVLAFVVGMVIGIIFRELINETSKMKGGNKKNGKFQFRENDE